MSHFKVHPAAAGRSDIPRRAAQIFPGGLLRYSPAGRSDIPQRAAQIFPGHPSFAAEDWLSHCCSQIHQRLPSLAMCCLTPCCVCVCVCVCAHAGVQDLPDVLLLLLLLLHLFPPTGIPRHSERSHHLAGAPSQCTI
jgi:hypothetical protein